MAGKSSEKTVLTPESFDVQALQRAMDSTFGRSSSPSGTESVKFRLQGRSHLVAIYNSVVNFSSTRMFLEEKRKHEDRANDCIKMAVKVLKEEYKDLADETLKLKQLESTPKDVQIEQLSSPMQKWQSAYFKKFVTFEIG